MNWLRKLWPRRESHEEWLTKHPGKESTHNLPPVNDDDEQQAIRDKMEGELDTQRDERNRA